MRWLRSNWLYIVLALGTAFAVHVASVAFLPHLIMTRALTKMSGLHGYNTMTHSVRATSASRAVVRPSPDLLYSVCPFDLGRDDTLLVSVSGMPKSYWSISVFDGETNNVFALNNTVAQSGSADVAIQLPLPPGSLSKTMPPPHPDDRSRYFAHVTTPTARGLVLVRTLIVDDKSLAAIDKARRTATCGLYRY